MSKSTVLVGWPETKQQVEQRIAEYREEIGVHNGVLYKGDRVIVPIILHKEIMKHIHASHQGEQACLRRPKMLCFDQDDATNQGSLE